MQVPKYHFTIDRQESLMANIELWEPAKEGVYEKMHSHSYYEMLVFKTGGGTHEMAGEINNVEDFSFHMLPTNTFHELKRVTKTDGFEIIFSESFIEQLQYFDSDTNYIHYFSTPRIQNLSREEFEEFQFYFNELLKHKGNKSIFYNIVSLIILKLIEKDKNIYKTKTNTTFENSLLKLINKHYKEKQSLEFYATNLNMSVNTLQRHAKSTHGKSVIDLQNEKIIQEVKFLLSQKIKSIKEIALEFNFTDESHFNHYFKKHIGVSPSKFRKPTTN